MKWLILNLGIASNASASVARNLRPPGDGGANHDEVFAALLPRLAGHIVSIEMLSTQNEPHYASIERAIDVATKIGEVL
jgi:hypothetical protein